MLLTNHSLEVVKLKAGLEVVKLKAGLEVACAVRYTEKVEVEDTNRPRQIC